MKIIALILTICLLHFSSYAQQATEIDSKSVKLPRYASQVAVTATKAAFNERILVSLEKLNIKFVNRLLEIQSAKLKVLL